MDKADAKLFCIVDKQMAWLTTITHTHVFAKQFSVLIKTTRSFSISGVSAKTEKFICFPLTRAVISVFRRLWNQGQSKALSPKQHMLPVADLVFYSNVWHFHHYSNLEKAKGMNNMSCQGPAIVPPRSVQRNWNHCHMFSCAYFMDIAFKMLEYSLLDIEMSDWIDTMGIKNKFIGKS